jgi:hypothetical protein
MSKLYAAGFSNEQAEAVLDALKSTMHESLESQTTLARLKVSK